MCTRGLGWEVGPVQDDAWGRERFYWCLQRLSSYTVFRMIWKRGERQHCERKFFKYCLRQVCIRKQTAVMNANDMKRNVCCVLNVLPILFQFLFSSGTVFLLRLTLSIGCVIWQKVCLTAVANIRRCIQKFPDWPPGARIANGTALCHWVQLYRYFVSQSSELCCRNPLSCFSTSVYCCKRIFRCRLSPETFGYTLIATQKLELCFACLVLTIFNHIWRLICCCLPSYLRTHDAQVFSTQMS
jgi:hypothetical protein